MDLFIDLLPFLLLLAIGYGVGTYTEHRHLQQLAERERQFADILVTTQRFVTGDESVQQASLVIGGAVIGSDYFKTIIGQLMNIIGGEVRVFRVLADRARREATLRMLEQARAMGATEVWSVRYESTSIRGSDKYQAASSAELFAYGTAIVRKRP
jgi:uncharacterized protein YbjQ (UPF0145 family)